MDLIKLDANKQPGPLVQNFDSLIWAERWNSTGDFSLVTGNINAFMEELPEGSLISLRDTTVPMIVETHDIERKKRTGEKLTIKGRAYESILDRRVSVKGFADSVVEWFVAAKLPSDVAHFIIEQICVQGINDPGDIFPASEVQFVTPSDYLSSPGPVREFAVPRGNLLATVLGFLQTEADEDPSTTPPSPKLEPRGLRAVRPNTMGTSIGIQIYPGTDRSAEIRFDGQRDMLNDGRYLFSKVGSANAAYVLGQASSAKMHQGATAPTGLDRRVILVDASSSGVESQEALRAEGSRAMSKAHVTAAFDGSINEDLSTYIYGVDYFLGDIVTLVGDYGLDTKARVTEYIRSYGPDGYKAFPTLTAIEEGEL